MTVPGVGPIAALSFKVGVDDPRRFTRSRKVGAHFGLTEHLRWAQIARVSTTGQTLDAQLAASGARVDRKELQRMLAKLEHGDVVTVTRIDRLARSLFDLFAIVQRINESGAVFRSIAEPWADTGTSTGRMMLAVMAGMADVERDLIRTRTAEGRARATARGQHMGRPPKLTPEQKREVCVPKT